MVSHLNRNPEPRHPPCCSSRSRPVAAILSRRLRGDLRRGADRPGDPPDRPLSGLAARDGLRIRYVIDTHTHADHFSAARALRPDSSAYRSSCTARARRRSSTCGCDDGDMLVVGKLRLQAMHTPGHTRDSMCLRVEDRVFTGDTLLIGATGRTDLPTGDPHALYDSLFNSVLKLDPASRCYPAHDYKGRRLEHASRTSSPRTRACKAARSRGVHRDDARAQPVGADAHHRGAAHQHERRQDGRAAAGRSRGKDAVHVARRAARAGRAQGRDLIVLDVREKRCLRGGPRAGRATSAARPARAARQPGAARSDAAHPHRLRVRQDLDARRRDVARDGLHARGRARRRHEGLARRGIPYCDD